MLNIRTLTKLNIKIPLKHKVRMVRETKPALSLHVEILYNYVNIKKKGYKKSKVNIFFILF